MADKENGMSEGLEERFEKLFMEPMAKELAEASPPSPFDAPKQRINRILSSLKASFNEFKGYLANAGRLLDEAKFTCSHIEEIKEKIRPPTYENIVRIAPQELTQVTESEFDQIYKLGCSHFEKATMQEPATSFFFRPLSTQKNMRPGLGWV